MWRDVGEFPKCSVNSYIHVLNCVFCTFLLRYSLEIFRQHVLQFKSFTGKKAINWKLGFRFYEDSLKTFRTSLVSVSSYDITKHTVFNNIFREINSLSLILE